MLKFIDNMSLLSLIVMALILGVVPYPMEAEPHSVQKIMMLLQGQLSKPLDIFDLFFHTAPTILLLIKLFRMYIMEVGSSIKPQE